MPESTKKTKVWKENSKSKWIIRNCFIETNARRYDEVVKQKSETNVYFSACWTFFWLLFSVCKITREKFPSSLFHFPRLFPWGFPLAPSLMIMMAQWRSMGDSLTFVVLHNRFSVQSSFITAARWVEICPRSCSIWVGCPQSYKSQCECF